MSGALRVDIDTAALERWASELSQRGLRNAIRRAVDQSATAARKIALDTMAKDIGVPKARLTAVVSRVKRTTQTNLSASFTANKSGINLAATGAKVSRIGGASGSTYRITGGPSTHLHARHAFVMSKGGAKFIVQRKGKERLPVKGIFAETASYALGEGNANEVWSKAASAEVQARLGREVQRQLIRETLSAATPADSGD